MKNKGLFIVIGVFLIVLFNSVIYGALNTEMFIDGDVYVRVDRNIRIKGIKVIEQVGGVYETYNCDYSKDTTSIQVTLPSSDSFIIYEVTITNKGDIDYEVSNIVEESYSNSNIKYEIIDLEKGTVVDRETSYTFKIKLTTTENDSENKGTLVLKYVFQEWVPSLYNMIAHKSRSLDTNLDFGVAPTKETSGVYEMNGTKNDEYPVYYYRGIVENNNVNFAGFCWKAVRTTSTGGVKLIYNGVPSDDGSCDNTGESSQIGISVFNTGERSIADASYQYDNGTDSAIKKVIDKWYSDNMIEYSGMLEDTEWCNDRSVYSTSGSYIYYSSYGRLTNLPYTPSLDCKTEDSFTVSENIGNGKLTYPVALLTADEVALAGYRSSENTESGYLYTGQNLWTLSPSYFSVYSGMFSFIDGRIYGTTGVIGGFGVRPSISLVNGTMIKEGNGSISSPYKLVGDKIKTEWTFDYTGGEQEFKVPYDGVYRLEVWGAQGGNANDTYIGGYGAYSFGDIELSKSDILYVNIGGQGSLPTGSKIIGGYNGGGDSNKVSTDSIGIGSGGGATHIATKSGVLLTLENDINKILIVASGGGGGAYPYFASNNYYQAIGGAGGGIIGNSSTGKSGYLSADYWEPCVGGTQNLQTDIIYGGEGHIFPATFGSFGKGGEYLGDNTSSSGGGGGYYGGAGCKNFAGGGGSSYIGNLLLSNKVMYCYNCQESNEESTRTISTTNVADKAISNYAKQGNGFASITFISKK